jgi:oxazoline/thiazoline dehydrogenase
VSDSASIRAGGRTVLTLHGTAGRRSRSTPRRAVLSRFAFVRRDGTRWVLESSLSPVRCELEDPSAFAMLAALAVPCTPRALAAAAKVPLEMASRTFDALSAAGFLTPARAASEATSEDRDDALATWEFADLLMHSRSRLGQFQHPVGGTFPFRGTLPPAPAIKPRMGGARVRLPRPEMRDVLAHDAPFSAVLERRRSARAFGGRALTLGELGEFLFRTARVSEPRKVAGAGYETTRRPYPSGGACYPLEVYLATDRCRGLRAGLHHYDPAAHALTSLRRSARGAGRLLGDAREAVRVNGQPTVLVILTARFHRVMWKYRGISYSTILKDVGVLLQTMNLVSTSMGLAGSAIGCGNVAVLADMIGADIQRESSVGEFLLGAPG